MTLLVTWAVVIATLLTSPAVLGFRMIDLLRGARQSDKSPTEAIIDLLMTELDANNDGQIAISEVDYFLDQSAVRFGWDRRNINRDKGYVLTLASLIDVDDNGQADNSELHQAASYLVNLAGVRQVGRLLSLKMDWERNSVDRLDLAGSIAADFHKVIDRNSDGLVSSDDIEDFSSLQMFRWEKETVRQHLTDEDEDNDGNLSTDETNSFLIMVATGHRWIFDKVYVYCQVYQLTGIGTANEWANS